MSLLHKELTDSVLKALYKVYNELGHGFLERVYQNALYYELLDMGFDITAQKRLIVYYNGRGVGEYIPDLIVENKVILELKAHENIILEHEMQLQNYLKATDIEIGLLLNFGPTPTFKRKIWLNENTTNRKI